MAEAQVHQMHIRRDQRRCRYLRQETIRPPPYPFLAAYRIYNDSYNGARARG